MFKTEMPLRLDNEILGVTLWQRLNGGSDGWKSLRSHLTERTERTCI